MTKSASTTKKPRKQHTPEYRQEALKLAERIGVAAAAGNPRDSDADNLLALQQYVDQLHDVDLTQSPLQLPATPGALG